MTLPRAALLLLCLGPACAPAGAAPATVALMAAPAVHLERAPLAVGGRAVTGAGGWTYQWPGMYFETAFSGPAIAFELGTGDVILHVILDGQPAATLEKPRPGLYRVAAHGSGPHTLRIETATESQAGPNRFGGFLLPPGSRARPVPQPRRRIEFIGDSHTVGYGNLSPRHECSPAQVWATTDTTRAFGPRLARRYGAAYRVNAISGRGVVRNYAGMPADTLPQAYPYLLFDRKRRDAGDGWQPQAVVVALGTNDFSTPLAAGEPWKDRDALHADYQRGYVAFVQSLRARYPQAYLVLWSTDLPEGELRAQVERVVARLRDAGEARVSYVPVDGLAMEGCDGHPSLADHARIAALLGAQLDRLPELWQDAASPVADRAR